LFHSFWLVHSHFSLLKALFLRPRRSAPGQGQSATKADAFHHAGDDFWWIFWGVVDVFSPKNGWGFLLDDGEVLVKTYRLDPFFWRIFFNERPLTVICNMVFSMLKPG
jgi:hypothetical protein